MRQPEKNRDNEHSPPDRQFDVMLHSAGDFRHKRWPARVSNRNSSGSRRGNEAVGCARLPGSPPRYLGGYGHGFSRNLFDRLEPLFALTIRGQIRRRFHIEQPESTVVGTETFLALTHGWGSACDLFRQPRQTEGVITQTSYFLRRKCCSELLASGRDCIGKFLGG